MKFDRFAQWLANHRAASDLRYCLDADHCLGRKRALVSFQRYMAAGYQYVDHDHRIPDGVPDPDTQNRDSDELHIKLDELLRTTQRAHKALLDLEDMGPAELHALRKRYQQLGNTTKRGRTGRTPIDVFKIKPRHCSDRGKAVTVYKPHFSHFGD